MVCGTSCTAPPETGSGWPFFVKNPSDSTRRAAEGSGLGLAIVKMFLDKYGAALEVFNNESGGATFRMTFNMIKQKQM
jgi:K+-sensing histidine kinase KdpD